MRGGRSASASSSPSSAKGDTSGMCCGRRGGSCDMLQLKFEMAQTSCVDVAVQVGVSTDCSISSCLTISSASSAWSGESEPEETEKQTRRGAKVALRQQDKVHSIVSTIRFKDGWKRKHCSELLQFRTDIFYYCPITLGFQLYDYTSWIKIGYYHYHFSLVRKS